MSLRRLRDVRDDVSGLVGLMAWIPGPLSLARLPRNDSLGLGGGNAAANGCLDMVRQMAERKIKFCDPAGMLDYAIAAGALSSRNEVTESRLCGNSQPCHSGRVAVRDAENRHSRVLKCGAALQ